MTAVAFADRHPALLAAAHGGDTGALEALLRLARPDVRLHRARTLAREYLLS